MRSLMAQVRTLPEILGMNNLAREVKKPPVRVTQPHGNSRGGGLDIDVLDVIYPLRFRF